MHIFQLDEIAHAIVMGKDDIIKSLKSIGLDIPDHADEESVFRYVLEHKADERVRTTLVKIHNEKPYYRHCHNCVDAIMPLTKKGIIINKAMAGEKPKGE